MEEIVLSLFDYTGNTVKPWAEKGYKCICIDKMQGTKRETIDGITYIQGDVLTDVVENIIHNYKVKIVFAFPPCTHLAVSGTSHFKEKGLKTLIKALQLVDRAIGLCEMCTNSKGKTSPWMIENPVSVLSSYWRKPDYIFDPCDFGMYNLLEPDDYTKRTCIWIDNGFRIPVCEWINPTKSNFISNMPKTPWRGDERSKTPLGFAYAVFDENII